MELTGALLDGSSYAIDRSGTPVELCLRAPGGAAALSFDLISSTFATAQGEWSLTRSRSLPYWRVKAQPRQGGPTLATARPAFAGFNAYEISLASGQQFRMKPRASRWHWRVRGRDGLALELLAGEGLRLDVHNSGLTQADLSLLVGMVLLMEQTNSIDNYAEGGKYGSNGMMG